MGRMKQVLHHIRVAVLSFLLFVPSCSKEGYRDVQMPYENAGGEEGMAIGTLRSRDGVRFIRLDGVSCSQIMNPKEVQDIPDGVRVFLQYRCVVAPAVTVADFCVDAILVEWASPLEVGEVRHDPSSFEGDPVSIITDWMTSLEDGFLTLHYQVPASGKMQHTFCICPVNPPYAYRLVHDAHADSGGKMTEGLICFDVEGILPETGEDAVELSLEYMDLDHTKKQLTVEYRSPK